MRSPRSQPRLSPRPGFSLLELVVVVVILGLIAALALPRVGRAGVHAQEQAALADLATLRRAVTVFIAQRPDPIDTPAEFAEHLATNAAADAAAEAAGPLLPAEPAASPTAEPGLLGSLRTIPVQRVGSNAGSATITFTPHADGHGWHFDPQTGRIRINTAIGDPRSVSSEGRPWWTY